MNKKLFLVSMLIQSTLCMAAASMPQGGLQDVIISQTVSATSYDQFINAFNFADEFTARRCMIGVNAAKSANRLNADVFIRSAAKGGKELIEAFMAYAKEEGLPVNESVLRLMAIAPEAGEYYGKIKLCNELSAYEQQLYLISNKLENPLKDNDQLANFIIDPMTFINSNNIPHDLAVNIFLKMGMYDLLSLLLLDNLLILRNKDEIIALCLREVKMPEAKEGLAFMVVQEKISIDFREDPLKKRYISK